MTTPLSLPGQSRLMMDELRALAASRGGVILARDLDQMGLDKNGRRQVLSLLMRLGRGVYCLTTPQGPADVHRLRTIACLHLNPGSCASHISAAILYGLPTFRPDLTRVHLSYPLASRLGPRGRVHVHQLTGDVVEVNGHLVTDLATTLVDCARSQSRETAVVLADAALHKGLTSPVLLKASVDRIGRAHNASKARTMVRLVDGRAESAGETRSRLICVDAGIGVTPQLLVCDARGNLLGRVDLGVDGYPLGIEFDGEGKYTDFQDPDEDAPSKHWQEKLRKELVEDHGRILVNLYWDMLDSPPLVLARVRRGMQRARKLAG